MRETYVAGNWKMHQTPSQAKELCRLFHQGADIRGTRVILCVPSPLLSAVAESLKGSNLALGAQNMHYESSGAYTGEVSAPMLTDLGVQYVILGHSERREYFAETDEAIQKKVKAALDHTLTPILCCGESLRQRELGITADWIRIQIKTALFGLTSEEAERILIAYEPIWAIGTGKTATAEEAQAVCHTIRTTLAELYSEKTAQTIPILYGGSVNGANASALFAMPDIDGGLVGGASLTPDFLTIAQAACRYHAD